mmetsp:Transcript_33323/g.102911  ORF Transcript_33323/g.102911 Transcript_33323/m.102911 type:complete len:298 (-) Transcript_33323:30-923(-)
MWAFAGPAIAAGFVVAAVVAKWQRTTVRLHRQVLSPFAKGRSHAMNAGQPRDSAGAKASAKAGAPPAMSDVHRIEESAHWIRRMAARPPVRRVVAGILQREMQGSFERLLADIQTRSRGWVVHADATVAIESLIPDLQPTCCDDDVNDASWVEVRAGCVCTGSAKVNLDIALAFDLTVPITFTVSELQIAGATARLHTAGSAAGDVEVLEVPEITCQLRTVVGRDDALVTLRDFAIIVVALEWIGWHKARAVVGAVFHGALTKVVERFLPEAVRMAGQEPAASSSDDMSAEQATLPS